MFKETDRVLRNRSDALLVDQMYKKRGLKAAAAYGKLPVIIMPANFDEIMNHKMDLPNAAPATLKVPFPDFILEFQNGNQAYALAYPQPHETRRDPLWVRVRQTEFIQKDDAASALGWDQISFLRSLPGRLLLEGRGDLGTPWGGAIAPYTAHSVIRTTLSPIDGTASYWHIYRSWCGTGMSMLGGDLRWCNVRRCVNPHARTFHCLEVDLPRSAICRMIELALIYIGEGLGTMRGVFWAPENGLEWSTEESKPWSVARRITYLVTPNGA